MALSALLLGPAPAAHAQAAPAACSLSKADIFRQAARSVVFIAAVSLDPFKLKGRVTTTAGAGFLIDREQRLVVTNAHVVAGAGHVIVTIRDDKSVSADVLGLDAVTDLAVLRLSEAADIPAVELGQSAALAVGDEVLSIGNPLGLDHTMSHGIISGLNRILPLRTTSWLVPFIQTDIAINPGNSGGPLIDRCGRVVGVLTVKIGEAENINFAVPIDTVKEILPQLVAKGHVSRPWHGIYGTVVPALLHLLLRAPIADGFLVETVEPGSPAEAIGLRGGFLPVKIGGREFLLGGDIILSVNGTPLSTVEATLAVARAMKVGDKLVIRYSHFGEWTIYEAEVVLPERPVLPADIAGVRLQAGE